MRSLALAAMFAATSALADVPAAPPGQSSSGGIAQVLQPQDAPRSIWRFGDEGGAEHLQSGLACPAAFNGYIRDRLTFYGPFGLDVSCNYIRSGRDLTVYMTRLDGKDLAAALDGAERALEQVGATAHPQRLSDGRAARAGLDWFSAAYAKDGGVRSDIWLAEIDGWALEYRASYPAADEQAVLADLDVLTATVRRSVGARLDACVKPAAADGSGKLVTDAELLKQWAMMSAIFGGVEEMAAQDPAHKSEADPVIWCPGRGLGANPRWMLSWRGVRPDGSDALAERVSLMTIGEPVVLEVKPDSLGGLIGDASDKAVGGTRWTATIKKDGRTSVFGYFSDRPSPEAMAALLDRIVQGKAKALISYGVKDKTLAIGTPPS